jgi:hypothetical protein
MSMSQENIYYPSETPLPYEAAEVRSQGFLDMLTLLPSLIFMFVFILLMGLMRDITREPGTAKKIVVTGLETGKEIVGAVVGR